MAKRNARLGTAAVVALVALAAPAAAQPEEPRHYPIEAKPLSEALRDVSRQSGREVMAAAELLEGKLSRPLRGRFTSEEAIERLLARTGLNADFSGPVVIIRGRGADEAALARDGEEGSSEIVVTGTRISGADPVGARVERIDREAIRQSGRSTTQDLLAALPQNFGGGSSEGTLGVTGTGDSFFNGALGSGVNLRGLGTGSTLVLIGGVRPPLGGFSGVFADVSLVPLTAIGRIEVLSDGASAIYGSDAVAGVVNIVLREEVDGAETVARLASADGDFEEVQLGQLAGLRWRGGRVSLAYEFRDRGRLRAADRDYFTEDLRRFGGPDLRTNVANPGTIVAGGRSFAIPAGQDGRDLEPSELIPDQVNRRDAREGTDILPAQRVHSALLALEQELGGTLTLFGRGHYANRAFDFRARPVSTALITVPAANPFYVDPLGTGQPVRVRYSFIPDLGAEERTGEAELASATLGARLERGRWNAELQASFGEQRERYRIDNIANSARLAQALADPDPATAFNPFGEGSNSAAATLERIRGFTQTRNRFRIWSLGAKADGPLLDLPAGPLRAALGVEYREERFRSSTLSDTSTVEPVRIVSPFPGTRRIRAGFAELLVPLVGEAMGVPAIERLTVSLAGRVEDYNDFGTTTNPRIGLDWFPVPELRLRGSYSSSFRAPGFASLQPGDPSFSAVVPNPAAPGGSANVLVLRGNDPAIGPERARSFNAGFDWRPGFAPGLALSASWFDIRYRDRIADPSAELFTIYSKLDIFGDLIDLSPSPEEIGRIYASPSFSNFAGLPASAIEAIIDGRVQNLAVLEQSGIDVALSYARPTPIGRFELGVDATRLFHIRQLVTATAPVSDVLGTLGNPAELRARGFAAWSLGGTSISAQLNHVGDYLNRRTTPPERIGSWTTLDLRLAHRFGDGGALAGLEIAASATNIFDRDPPYAANLLLSSGVGYDPENANALGRVLSLQLSKTW